MTRARVLAAVAVALSVAVLAACGNDTGPETTPTTPAPVTAVPTSPAPSPTHDAASEEEATCESIIPASVVAEYEKVGWTAKAETFRVGEVEIAEGLQCMWGDYSVATDHVQVFGWAPVSAAEAAAAASDLLANGWVREDGDGGFYVTENPQTAIAVDEQGYGFTYFFGDGYVTLADTKQSLVLIERPGA